MSIDKKSAAQDLFNAGYEQKRIASVLGLSEQTVSAWKQKHRWEEKRATKNMARDVAEDRVWKMINFQLKVLDLQVDEQENKLASKEIEKLKPLDKGDVDALQKLWTTVRTKQLDWSVIVHSVQELIGFISERDLDLAKRLTAVADDYLNFKRKNL
jgi:predicted transcriptional regulator